MALLDLTSPPLESEVGCLIGILKSQPASQQPPMVCSNSIWWRTHTSRKMELLKLSFPVLPPGGAGAFEVVRGQTTSAIKQEQKSCSHAEDPVVKELGEA